MIYGSVFISGIIVGCSAGVSFVDCRRVVIVDVLNFHDRVWIVVVAIGVVLVDVCHVLSKISCFSPLADAKCDAARSEKKDSHSNAS